MRVHDRDAVFVVEKKKKRKAFKKATSDIATQPLNILIKAFRNQSIISRPIDSLTSGLASMCIIVF